MNTWTKKNKNINQEDHTGQGMMSGSRWKRELHALSFGTILACAPLSAQTPPDDYDYAGQTSKDLFERELRLREKEKKPNLPAITEQTEPTEEVTGGPTFILRGIRFTKSAHLTQEELQNIVQPALGEEIDYNGLQKILGTINQLYRQKNIYTAVAVFPEQEVSDGVVIIRLVEGSIGEIVFEGNKYTEDGYFREWIEYDNQLASIDIEALEKDILFYNRIHNQRLQAELRAGKAFGLTDIVINVPEPGRDSLDATKHISILNSS